MKPLLPLCILLFVLSCGHFQCDVAYDSSSKDYPELSSQTKTLYNNLKGVAKTNLLFGHQDAVAYGVNWWGGSFNSDVEKVCGDYPAVFGWDIGHIDNTRNIDSVLFEDMRNWIVEVYNRGGVNTVGWHQRNLSNGGSSWNATPVVKRMLSDGDLNQAFNIQLDKVASFFNSCQTSEGIKVPIIFRPYHEHNGGWFWWGNKTCSDEEYKQLWQYTYTYLRKTKGVNNLLFTYSTDAFAGREEYLSRYPGDEYVDVLGWDDYKSVRTKDTRQVFIDRIDIVNTLAIEKDKLACLSETGYETLSLENWWTDVLLNGYKAAPNTDRIAYLLVWRNARPDHHYAPYPGQVSEEDFKNFKNDTITVFLNDLPNMYE